MTTQRKAMWRACVLSCSLLRTLPPLKNPLTQVELKTLCLDTARPALHNPLMVAAFDTLAAAEALEQSGMDTRQARACAAQMNLASQAGEPVTRAELDTALAELKTELVERIAKTEVRLTERMSAYLWRLFGGLVALAGLIVAALRYLPPPAGG